jgi:UDP-N-acetylglucosamine--N-acetylmuramyl-(pentapeptide) pyrophosphoryl-undecaprenol N-acetylglucosamine transferase
LNPKRIVLTGGGTAGHIAPNIALIPHLKEAGYEIHYIGAKDSLEQQLMQKEEGVCFHSIPVGKLRRYFDWKNFTDPFRVMSGTAQAANLIKKLKPRIVFAKGGFASVPVVYGAKLASVPVVLHESDFTPGLANKICMPMCVKICTAFAETADNLGEKAVYTGLPVREALLSGDRARGLAIAGFKSRRPVLLIMGGSQGAAAINEAVRAAIRQLVARFDIIHLCGPGNLSPVLTGIRGYFQMEYAREDLPHLYAATDVALSRAGAGAIFEFLAMCIPTLLVPLPTEASRGDQIDNARYFTNLGYVETLPQEDMTPESLAEALFGVYYKRESYRLRMKSAGAGDAIGRVMAEIQKAALK